MASMALCLSSTRRLAAWVVMATCLQTASLQRKRSGCSLHFVSGAVGAGGAVASAGNSDAVLVDSGGQEDKREFLQLLIKFWRLVRWHLCARRRCMRGFFFCALVSRHPEVFLLLLPLRVPVLLLQCLVMWLVESSSCVLLPGKCKCILLCNAAIQKILSARPSVTESKRGMSNNSLSPTPHSILSQWYYCPLLSESTDTGLSSHSPP